MWDWWDDVVDTVSGLVDDGIAWVNDVVDTYIYDSSEEQAVAEAVVDNLIDTYIYDSTEEQAVAEAWVDEFIDSYIWDTTTDEAIIEEWVRDTFDIPDKEGEGFVEEVVEDIIDTWNEDVDKVVKAAGGAAQTIATTATTVVDTVGDIITNASLVLGIGFDAAMAALAGLPGMLLEWRNDLANFFTFDMDEFMKAMETMSEKMRTKE
ncbi:hypothetical protein ES703_25095 [subsurface metagenome]